MTNSHQLRLLRRGTQNRRAPLTAPLHDQVASVAYTLYLHRGRIEGHAMEDWLAAEQIVRRCCKTWCHDPSPCVN